MALALLVYPLGLSCFRDILWEKSLRKLFCFVTSCSAFMLLILFVSMEEVIDLATVFYLFFLP